MEKTNYVTTKQTLMNVEVPVETRTYKPVSHRQLIDLTLESLDKAGFKVAQESYSSAKDGKVANGKYLIQNVRDSEMCLQINWRNSLDKSKSLLYSIGVGILLCKNGLMRGDSTSFRKKHQGEIQEFTPVAISEYIRNGGEIFKQLQVMRDRMKDIELDNRTISHLVGRMFMEEDFITTTQMSVLRREISLPTYNYNTNPNSLWQIYQNATFSMRETHPSLWMENHIKANDFFEKLLENPMEFKTPDLSNYTPPNQLEVFTDVVG